MNEITFLAATHSPAVLAVDTVLAYTVGNRLQVRGGVAGRAGARLRRRRYPPPPSRQVEVDVLVAPGMPLPVAHDVGEGLQHAVERLDGVERCFVHLDTETDHRRNDEHVDPYDS